MNLNSAITVTSLNRQHQIKTDNGVDDEADSGIKAPINRALTTIKTAVNRAMGMTLMDNAVTAKASKLLPTSAASAEQIKYLNDQTSKYGTALGK